MSTTYWHRRTAAQERLRKKYFRKSSKRILEVFEIYKRTLSLTKAGEALGICRERVRQLLEQGHCRGIITYFGTREARHLAVLLAKADREELARDFSALTEAEFCAKYDAPYMLWYKLRQYTAKGRSFADLSTSVA